jgi:hypothetical protein
VRQGSNQLNAKEQHAEIRAVHVCRDEQSTDPEQFKADFGTARNAFAKCVTHEKHSQEQPQQPQT